MTRMKLTGVRQVAREEVPPPVAEDGTAVIRVEAVGICGSDMHVYLGQNPVIRPENHVCGHEFGGTIKGLPDQAGDWKVGDKVCINPVLNCGHCYYCLNDMGYMCSDVEVIGGEVDGAMADEILVPITTLVKLAENCDSSYLAMVEPTAVAVHSTRNIADGNVLVIGLGTIGLLTVQMCKLRGNTVIATDIDDENFALAKTLGADGLFRIHDETPDEITSKYLGQAKLDYVIDNVNHRSTTDFGIKALRKKGELVVVGIPHENFVVDMIDLLVKEITLSSSYLYSYVEFREAANLVSNGQIEVQKLVSKRFRLIETHDAFEYKLSTKCIKVLIEP